MFDPWIDGARTLLTSNLVVVAIVVCGGVVALAIAWALAKRIGRSPAGDGWAGNHSFGQEATTGESPQTPSAAGRGTLGATPMPSLPGGAAPARRRRRGGIPVLVGIGVIAAGGWAVRYGTAELALWDSPEYREKAGFDALFEQARKRPVHEVMPNADKLEPADFTITRHEIRDEYLVTTLFTCHTTGSLGWVRTRTISVRDRNMRPVGEPDSLDTHYSPSFPANADEKGQVRLQALLDDLADGTVDFKWNDEDIDRHLRSVKADLNNRKARAAARDAEYARRARGDG